MEGLDLRGVQAAVESWIVDDVLVTRDQGAVDDQLDEETGVLATGEPVEVYAGKGAVQPLGQEQLQDPDVAAIVASTSATHRALLPVADAGDVEFQYDDLFRVTAANGFTPDPRATETRWTVVHPGTASTWTVVRFLYLVEQRTEPAPTL